MKTIKNYLNGLKATFKACKRVSNDLEAYHAMEAVYYQTGML